MAERHAVGVLDTCAYIDLDVLDPSDLPVRPEITAVTLAELQQGVAMAKSAAARSVRMEKLGAAVTDFDPLVFDGEAAARYGTLVSLTLDSNRDPRPRKLDLMIAAIASVHGMPLFTRNVADFKGLESAVAVVAL